jgi:hypothetical protein
MTGLSGKNLKIAKKLPFSGIDSYDVGIVVKAEASCPILSKPPPLGRPDRRRETKGRLTH